MGGALQYKVMLEVLALIGGSDLNHKKQGTIR